MTQPLGAEETNRGFPIAFVAGLLVVGLLVGGAWWLSANQPKTAKAQPLPFGDSEQKYAARIEFTDIKMNRTANFLDQQVTAIFGFVENKGTRTIRQMEVRLEFRNLLGQVVLRDERRIFGPREGSLGGGRRSEFQFNFEHIPEDWNRHTPQFTVTGLDLGQ